MLIASIDPGKGGAVSIIEELTPLDFYEMPLVRRGSKEIICGDKLREILMAYNEEDDILLVAVIEQVGSSPKMGPSGAFDFGRSCGLIEGVCIGMGVPSYFITPQQWKTYHGLMKQEKDAARIKALKMYPQLKDELKRKKDVDKADALLMGLAWQAVFMKKATD